jgi:hypothetical protein
MITTTIGGSIGWWFGQRMGYFTAFVLSVVGFGVGMWGGRRLARRWSLD